jgi:hypothetical protein
VGGCFAIRRGRAQALILPATNLSQTSFKLAEFRNRPIKEEEKRFANQFDSCDTAFSHILRSA